LFYDDSQVDVADCDADTALHAATSTLHLHVIKRLTEVLKDHELAELLARPNTRGSTPLHCSFDKHRLDEVGVNKKVTEVLEFLVQLYKKHSVSVDLQDSDRATPLYLAAKYEVPESVRVLIGAGADVNIPTSWGDTPLTVAAAVPTAAAVEVMTELLAAGADPNATLERSKETALHLVVTSGLPEDDCVRVCEKLIDAGGDVNALDADETSPIARAAEHHRQKLVRSAIPCKLLSPVSYSSPLRIDLSRM
jgi:ankyrin repeat protein